MTATRPLLLNVILAVPQHNEHKRCVEEMRGLLLVMTNGLWPYCQ